MHGHDYRPIPCQLFDWTLAQIDYDLSKLTFVDYGAGKGRVLLLAAEHPFSAVGGIEFAEELHDNAADEYRAVSRARACSAAMWNACSRMPSQVGPPDGEAVHYFFNPFSREVFAEVLNNIVVSYRRSRGGFISFSSTRWRPISSTPAACSPASSFPCSSI